MIYMKTFPLAMILTLLSCVEKEVTTEQNYVVNPFDRNDTIFGKVQSLHVESYIVKEVYGELIIDSTSSNSLFYNYSQTYNYKKNGLIDNISYEENSNALRKYTYNKKNELQKFENYKNYPDSIWSKEVFVYDGKGRLEKHKIYLQNADSIWEAKHYEYNDADELIELKQYRSFGLSGVDKNSYDKKHNLVRKEIRTVNGELDRVETYQYDEKGNEIYREIQNNYGQVTGTFNFKYDSINNLIQKDLYVFLDNAKLLGSTEKYKYDKHRNQIERLIKDVGEKERFETFKFIYDKKGNWIELIIYHNYKAIKKTTRIIQYYQF